MCYFSTDVMHGQRLTVYLSNAGNDCLLDGLLWTVDHLWAFVQ